MISSDSEETPDVEDTQGEPKPVRIDRRTIKRAPWRTTILEDGATKYNDKPNDPLYFQKYYDAKRKFQDASRYVCECCNKEIAYGHKARHLKTKYCVRAQNAKMEGLLLG